MSAASLSVNAVSEVFQVEKVDRVKISVFGVAVQLDSFQSPAFQQRGEGTDGVFSAHGTDHQKLLQGWGVGDGGKVGDQTLAVFAKQKTLECGISAHIP